MASFPVVRIRKEEADLIAKLAEMTGEKPEDIVHRLLKIGRGNFAENLREIAERVERVAVPA